MSANNKLKRTTTRKHVNDLINMAKVGDEPALSAIVVTVTETITNGKPTGAYRLLTRLSVHAAIVLLTQVIHNLEQQADKNAQETSSQNKSVVVQPLGNIRGMPPEGEA